MVLKKITRIIVLTVFATLPAVAQQQQRLAFVDSEYILNNIPAYKSAQAQIDKLSADWQKEIETQYGEVDKLYKNYQAEKVMLSEDMKKKREDEIIQKEQSVKDLQMKYYGPDGELAKKQQDLVKPIQDEVFKAIKELALEGRYDAVFDTSADATILYANPRQDRSDEILERLGYKK